jgi:Holliday junction resolvase RusA-like endonuclease
MNIQFVIPVAPRGKERPRFANGHTYTPKETRNYEELVRREYIAQTGGKKLSGPLKVSMFAIFPINASDSKVIQNRKMEGELKPTKKPDCDNIAKSILDAINGVAYDDDKQVVTLHIEKEYGAIGSVEVVIGEIDD